MRWGIERAQGLDMPNGPDWWRLARSVVDRGTVVLFFGLVGVAALPMGANRDWAWAPLCVLFGLMAIPVALGLGVHDRYQVATTERGPLLALVGCWSFFVGFSLWQTTTWTPLTADAWMFARAAEILGEAHAPIPAVAADLARNSLLKCLACALIFLTARVLCRDRHNARWFLVALVASGVLVVSYGIAMQVSTNSCYLGSYLRKQFEFNSGDRCLMGGTFVNSNSFACYMGMCVVAALALLFGGGRKNDPMTSGYREVEEARLIDWLTTSRLLLLSASLLMLGGLLISASRAGAGASVGGMILLGLLMMRGRRRSRSGSGAVLVLGIAALLVVGVIAGSALITKFAAASDDTSRLRIWSAAIQAIGMSPWLGWGLGGFGDVFALLQPSDSLQPNDIAHSTPLETVVELGVIAAMPAILVVLLPWAVCLRGALKRRTSRRYLPAAAFSVAAVSILHSVVDFSLQIPAIGFVTAGLLGMGWAQSFGRRDGVEAADV